MKSVYITLLILTAFSVWGFTQKDSLEFPVKFTGAEIWNVSFLNSWSEDNGSGAVKSLDNATLNYDHSASTSATVLNGTAAISPEYPVSWISGCSDSWTCEFKLRFNSISNGFALWLGTGAGRIIVEIYPDRTQDSGADSFSILHNNIDGNFHRFRIIHDSTNQLYYVWRDNLLLTPNGAAYDSTSSDNRLLLGDYTRYSFGDYFDVDISWIRFDQNGAYIPPAEPDPSLLYAWYRGDDGIIQNSSGIAIWENQATSVNSFNRNLNHVVGTPAAIELMTPHGTRTAARFDGYDGLWSTAGDFGSLDITKTLIFALRINDPEDGFLFDGSTNTGMTRSQIRSGMWQVGIQPPPITNAPNPDPVTTGVTTGIWQIHTFTFEKNAVETIIDHYVDGTHCKAVTNSYTYPLGGFILGMNAAAQMGLNADISEVLIYSNLLSTAQRTLSENYLIDKWAETIDIAMELESTEITQTPRDVAPFGLHQVIGIELNTIYESNPLVLTNISLSMEGTGDKSEVSSLRIYYTGSDSTFSPTALFGEYTGSMTSRIEIAGTQQLISGRNCFHVTYVLNEPASIGNTLDAVCLQLGVQGYGGITPETPAPQGSLVIKNIPHKLEIRHRGEEGVNTYRIPALATATNGTLISVFDIRHNSSADLPANIDIGMRRSVDNGSTWQPMQTILDMGDDPAWNYDGVGDPCILLDRVTGRIWVAALWSHGNNSWSGSGPGLLPEETGQFVMTYSDDNGESWSSPVNITSQIKDPSWNLCFQGPGNGFTARDGTLVMPAQYKDGSGVPRSCFIYSTDRGTTWQISNPAVPSGIPNTTESQMVELNNGDYMISMRNHAGLGLRAWATTSDEGSSWSSISYANPDPVCQASFIRHSSTLDGAPENILLFSNPASSSSRINMTIRMSRDEGASWTSSRLLDSRLSGYSCMTVLQDGTAGILYEAGESSSIDTLTFARFSIDWLTRGAGTRLQYGFDYTEGLVADHDAGLIADDSESDYPGVVLFHEPAYSPDIPPVNLRNNCLGIGSLDVRNDHHTVKSRDSGIITIDDLTKNKGVTLEVWAKQDYSREYGTILSLSDSISIVSQTTGTNCYRIVIDDAAIPAPLYLINESAKTQAGWTHIAAVIRNFTPEPSGSSELWINGELVDSTPLTVTPQLNPALAAGMGSRTGSTSGIWRWDGLIYEPRITARALTPEEFTYRRAGTIFLLN